MNLQDIDTEQLLTIEYNLLFVYNDNLYYVNVWEGGIPDELTVTQIAQRCGIYFEAIKPKEVKLPTDITVQLLT